MKIILDFGNTLKKIAIFENNEIENLKIIEKENYSKIEAYLSKNVRNNSNLSKVIPAILSSVINYPDSFRRFMVENFNFIELTEKTPIPVINKYKTESTLGKDRLAAIIGANHIFPKNNVLSIDCGTCITYDLITKSGEYLGGGISPGIAMRFKALHNFTDKLPLMSSTNFSELIGTTTEESILSGVLNGVVTEIEGIIQRYQKKFAELEIILSGGDINYFDKTLKNNIFAVPNLVLLGLNVILDYNVGR
ncbi:MAG: type III pantothenate kinase [Bacteroidales bacterium]|nr:type III pantothenate kinase [Bacteroidales bacterium]